jgi:hypothetical protein
LIRRLPAYAQHPFCASKGSAFLVEVLPAVSAVTGLRDIVGIAMNEIADGGV